MQLSPLDIRKQTFKRTLRGVDPEEVRMFLELVASEFEKVVQENAMMAEKISYQDERLDEYRDLEKSLRNSLVTAERIASESREASDREAQRIIQDAHSRAERILEDSRERLQRLVQEIEGLANKKETYVRRFKAMLEGQLTVLSDHEEQFGEIDSIADDAHEALSRSSSRDKEYARVSAPRAPVSDHRSGTTTAPRRVAAAVSRANSVAVETESEDWMGTRDREELPFDERNTYRSASAADSAGGDPEGFFEVQERREGFFQVDASEELDEYEPRRAD
ncbi:MAG: DivIVA domain-containing protein [Candidatus Eisenbacteria bacterium]|uniref:DivIVA domain-containing protein n=1 Tax=Eiseniibacteriota bacterium TaxID=2212470 RepID=A0A956SCK8_UNCEI|nr:DivIVA domain-containing protein [Candidatus Eisenbacteria bacterium]MCB9463166.1 DivIVA domain-containing protein [Candidatus Eisenbacteria bacterium]